MWGKISSWNDTWFADMELRDFSTSFLQPELWHPLSAGHHVLDRKAEPQEEISNEQEEQVVNCRLCPFIDKSRILLQDDHESIFSKSKDNTDQNVTEVLRCSEYVSVVLPSILSQC